MAGDLILALRTAQSGLFASQQALDAVSNNVANVNTPGYSRKIVNLEHQVRAGSGAGVQLSQLTRRVDEGLVKNLRLELGALNASKVQETFHARIQDLFGRPGDNTTLSHTLTQFQAAIESLADAPESTLQQREVVRWGQEVAFKLHEASATIQDLRREADARIGQAADEINDLTARIADLNKKIMRNEATSRDVTGLEDQRDQALDRLSELVDVRVFNRPSGDVVVFTASGKTLVDNGAVTLTHSVAVSVDAGTTYAEGDFAGIYVGEASSENDITNDLRGGELAELIDLRDRMLPNLQSSVDELAANLRETVNRIHNRGTPFPGRQTITGSRTFVAPSTQTITLTGGGDIAITLFDGKGDQRAATTLETIMQSAAFGSGAQVAHGPWTINEVASKVKDWLQGNGAATASVDVNADGTFAINLNTSGLNLAFRDQAGTTAGSAREDAVIQFDADGDTQVDETVSGFSFFFGLNDFFTGGPTGAVYESNVTNSSFAASAATLSFRNSAGAMGGSVTIAAGASLADITDAINDADLGLTAGVVPDGSGFRLRISSNDGTSFTVTQDVGGGDTLLTELGLHGAEVGSSGTLAVRDDIVASPSRIARGVVQWNAELEASGRYFVSVGDDAVIQELASAFGAATAFDAAGDLAATQQTLSRYAADILSHSSTLAAIHKDRTEDQQALVDSLKTKSDSVRGVNLDEEMSDLMLYEQAYSAAARVISVIQDMFEALDRAVA